MTSDWSHVRDDDRSPSRPSWCYEGDYVMTLSSIHHALPPRTYVEIGLYRAKTLSLVEPETLAIGIDLHLAVAGPLTSPNQNQ